MATLTFKGKTFVQNHHLAVKYHQLVPKKDKSLTKKVSLNDNLIIHGDNLKALKALLPTYAGKVKCIYIDPPYNTGNEKWVYSDNVNSPMMQEWLGKVVDKDDLTRHDKWLCMMMPRLKLLKELMRDDGVIFVSIDNNEVNNLKLLMDEVFGEYNYITTISNINNPKGRSDDKYVPTAHEYLILYKKNEPILYGWKPEEKVIRRYRKTAINGKKYREIDLRKTGDEDRKEDREDMFFFFYYNPKTREFFPSKENLTLGNEFIEIVPLRQDGSLGRWRWSLDSAKQNIDILCPILMPRRRVWSVFEIDYFEKDESVKPTSAWTKKDFNSERGTEEFLDLGFQKEDFPRPKPVGLLKHILEFSTSSGDVILDSFAGSGTTGQAVLELNREGTGKRTFILVECEDYADKITAERIRRVIKGVPSASDEMLRQGLGGSFSYFELGDPIEIENILKGNKLPTYLELARYIYYTASGEEFNDKVVDEKKQFIGESSQYEIYLFYKQDIEYLKSTALTLDVAKNLGPYKGKTRLVFAPSKYLDLNDSELIERHGLRGIEYCQLPFEIYKLKE